MPNTKRARTGSGGAAPQAEAAPADDNAAGPGPGSSHAAGGVAVLHRSRMFDWRPSAVVCIAACPAGPLFAVAYENGSLELWDVNYYVCTQVRRGVRCDRAAGLCPLPACVACGGACTFIAAHALLFF